MQCIECGKTIGETTYNQRFCCKSCESKFNKRKRELMRMEQGLCPKCGGTMDYPMRIGGPGAAEKKQKISYCSKCRDNYRRRYKEKKQQEETAPASGKTIMWFSRHPALPSQVAELKQLFGENVKVVPDSKPFSTADDVVRRFRDCGANEMVIVAPLSVIGAICDRGIKPLWAEMEIVPDKEAEVVTAGRGYKFIRFRRIKRLMLKFEEIEKPGK